MICLTLVKCVELVLGDGYLVFICAGHLESGDDQHQDRDLAGELRSVRSCKSG